MKTKHTIYRFNLLISALLLFGLLSGNFLAGAALAQDQPSGPPEPPVRKPPAVQARQDPLAPLTIKPATANQLALAMGVPASDLVSADLMGSDPAGVGVSDAALGSWFPTEGSTFAILSTGLAADASLPNLEPDHSTELGGLNNDQGQDLVRLHLRLNVPGTANCASFDFAYYSEEFPEYVGSIFNDTFTAQLNDSSLSTDQNDNVVAPGNFAFDTQGNVISINTVFGVNPPVGTTYDGVTPLLRAHTAVTPNAQIDLYLSVQDLGDSIYDSAVFLDKFFWSADPNCSEGAEADTDGDGLLDNWETKGITVTVGGVNEFVNLPAMGARVDHKDVFVEIDYMGASGGHSHAPKAAAIQKIVDAFDAAPVDNPDGTTGIHLHVDYGPTAPLTWGAAATWGSLSHSEVLAHQTYVSTCPGGNFSWSGFDTIKQDHFTAGRAAAFHYNVWAHSLCSDMAGTSGISRNAGGAAFGSGASDFIISLGGWPGSEGTVDEQAGTFMHELGHNLGLRHGGDDHTQWKPNYLSVMSYANQTRGLIINNTGGHFDYSRYDLADLHENNLNETVGINVPAGVTATLGTRYFCGQDNMRVVLDASQVDWNCDGDASDASVSRNINQGVYWNNNTSLDTLTSQNDWANLVYTGGAIAQPGASVNLPSLSPVIDIDVIQDASIPSAPTTPNVDLLVKTLSQLKTGPDREVVIPVYYDNYGITTAASTTLTATVSAGLTYLSDTSGISPTVKGNKIVWDLSDVAMTQGGRFNLTLKVPSGAYGTGYSVNFVIHSKGTEANPADNAASLKVMISRLFYLPILTR